MKRLKISLAAFAFVLATGAAFATKSNSGSVQCTNNVPPALCPFESATLECCYTEDESGTHIWSQLP